MKYSSDVRLWSFVLKIVRTSSKLNPLMILSISCRSLLHVSLDQKPSMTMKPSLSNCVRRVSSESLDNLFSFSTEVLMVANRAAHNHTAITHEGVSEGHPSSHDDTIADMTATPSEPLSRPAYPVICCDLRLEHYASDFAAGAGRLTSHGCVEASCESLMPAQHGGAPLDVTDSFAE